MTATAGPTRGGARAIHADRRRLRPWLRWSVVASSALCAATAGHAVVWRSDVPTVVGTVVAMAAATVAVLGLTSLSIRLVARLLVVVSGAMVVRFGTLSASMVGGSQWVLAWLVGAVGVFVLTDRVATDAQPGLVPAGGPGTGPGEARGDTSGGLARPAPTARTVVGASVVVVTVALVLAPLAMPLLTQSAVAGEGPRIDDTGTFATSLRSSDAIDMTTRPELTDDIVFTVDSERGTFWRGETFDRWDGRRWTRSEPERAPLGPGGEVRIGADDLGAGGGDVFTQRVRIEATYADVVFAAPSAVDVDARQPLAQRADGTVTTATGAMGRGATYTVTSRREPAGEERLRAADDAEVPERIRARYAAPPVATDRVLEAAVTATEGATTTYDRIRALEAWMGDRTEYSLDAPLSPEGVDVVDHFLFDSQLGWCEQVASSLVVLARANGIPARLVTGFVPDDQDPVTGTYLVRARNAHAWTEVWFPDLGWVAFDPTADVPLAGADDAGPTLGERLLDNLAFILLGVAALAVLVGPVRARWRRRVERRGTDPLTWAGAADRRLGDLGARIGRSRRPGETATAYAAALADLLGVPSLAPVGTTIDAALYAPGPPTTAACDAADAVLADLADAVVPEPAPA